VLPHASHTAQSWIMSSAKGRDQSSRPRHARTVLDAVKPASRRLRRWPSARLDRVCARRSCQTAVGTKKRLGRTKKLIKEIEK